MLSVTLYIVMYNPELKIEKGQEKEGIAKGQETDRKRIIILFLSVCYPFSICLLSVSYLFATPSFFYPLSNRFLSFCYPILFLSFCQPFSVFRFVVNLYHFISRRTNWFCPPAARTSGSCLPQHPANTPLSSSRLVLVFQNKVKVPKYILNRYPL